MTKPPASGMCLRIWIRRVWAARSTDGIQSPPGSSAVRQARVVSSGLMIVPSRAENSSPAESRHRASPEYARNTTGRTTPSRNASA